MQHLSGSSAYMLSLSPTLATLQEACNIDLKIVLLLLIIIIRFILLCVCVWSLTVLCR